MADNEVAALKEARLLALSQKQEAYLKKFWGAYVKDDPRLLQELCSEFEQYTVETIPWIPFDSTEYFEREIKQDAHLSILKGLDPWQYIHKARCDAQGNPRRPTAPASVHGQRILSLFGRLLVRLGFLLGVSVSDSPAAKVISYSSPTFPFIFCLFLTGRNILWPRPKP